MANFSPKCTISTFSTVLDSDTPFVSKVFVSPVYIDLLFDTTEDGCRIYHSSDSVVLNTERLTNLLGSDSARAVIDEVRSNLSNFSPSDSDSLSDDQILQFVRSRHIQSPAELRSWIDTFDDKASKIRDYFAYLNSFKSDQPKKSDQPEMSDKFE